MSQLTWPRARRRVLSAVSAVGLTVVFVAALGSPSSGSATSKKIPQRLTRAFIVIPFGSFECGAAVKVMKEM